MTHQSPLIVDLGCGNAKVPGTFGVDRLQLDGVDAICDFDKERLPFADSSVDEIICNHVIEHVDDLLAFTTEIHRVLKPNGVFRGVTPHFSNPASFTDPTHRRHFTFGTFYFFAKHEAPSSLRRTINRLFGCDEYRHSFYGPTLFKVKSIQLCGRLLSRYLADPVANRFPEYFDTWYCRWLPSKDLFFELTVMK